MNRPDNPKALLDCPDEDSELLTLLAAGRDELPSSDQMDGLGRRLAATLPAGALPTAATTAAATTAKVVAAKAGVAAGVTTTTTAVSTIGASIGAGGLGKAGLGALLMTLVGTTVVGTASVVLWPEADGGAEQPSTSPRDVARGTEPAVVSPSGAHHPEPTAPATTQADEPGEPEIGEPEIGEPEMGPEISEPEIGQPTRWLAASPARPSREGLSAGPPPVAPPVESEVSLLRRARQTLGTNPSRALEILETHGRTHASGTLGQEREVMRIEALVRMGRNEEATREGEQFLVRYPSSTHTRRVRVLIDLHTR